MRTRFTLDEACAMLHEAFDEELLTFRVFADLLKQVDPADRREFHAAYVSLQADAPDEPAPRNGQWHTGRKFADPDVVSIFVSTSLSGSGQFVEQAFERAERMLRRTSDFDGDFIYRCIGRPGAEDCLCLWLAEMDEDVDMLDERTGTRRDLIACLWTADAAILLWDGVDAQGPLIIHELESRGLPFVAMCLDPLTGDVTPLARKAPWVAYSEPEPAERVVFGEREDAVAGVEGRPEWQGRYLVERATFYQPVGQDVTAQVETLLKPHSFAEQDDDREWFGRGTVQKEPALDWRSDLFDSELQEVGEPDYAAVISE